MSLLKNRKRDILQIGAGVKKEKITLFKMGSGSTTSKIFSKGISEYININIDTLSNICKK